MRGIEEKFGAVRIEFRKPGKYKVKLSTMPNILMSREEYNKMYIDVHGKPAPKSPSPITREQYESRCFLFGDWPPKHPFDELVKQVYSVDIYSIIKM